MKKYSYFLLLLLISACSTVGNKQTFESLQFLELGKPLTHDSRVAIQIPPNGRFDDTLYTNSGEQTASAFKSAFEKYAKSVTLLPGCVEQECIIDARSSDSDYFISLEIVYWEDRATTISGKLDRLTIKFSIFDVATSTELSTAYLHVNTSIDTPSGGHVEDFLPSLAQQYVSSLF